MSELVLKIIFLVFFIATGFIRSPYEKRQKQNTIVNDQRTGLEKTLLAGAFLGMAVLPLLYILSPWLNFANYQLPTWAAVIGILLIPPTLWLFYRSHKDLGLNWSPSLEVRSEHNLVTNGVYKNIRHPMYTSIWLWIILQPLLLQNYIAGLSGLVFFGILYFLRVDREENMMIQQFGEEYRDYMGRTGRLLPKL
ncbi:MAG: protein-S-isoprenylcysteine O-methyltransferase [Bacteroidota bacterium]